MLLMFNPLYRVSSQIYDLIAHKANTFPPLSISLTQQPSRLFVLDLLCFLKISKPELNLDKWPFLC